MTSHFPRSVIALLSLLLSLFNMAAQEQRMIVADSATHQPLPSASIFDRHGRAVGVCNSKGRTPYLSTSDYPVTVRFLGYKEKVVLSDSNDTIFLQENPAELPEVIVESRQHKVLHVLAYVREYSTLSTYTDTVFLFREKMVDYMLPSDKKVRFNGWSTPRMLKAGSYYHFTNAQGLDSVSDRCSHHFSWSDWIGIVSTPRLPDLLRDVESGTDTIRGKYSPTEIWIKNNGRVAVDIDVLADTTSRQWVPNLSGFFRDGLDFENFKMRFNYDNVTYGSFSPLDLTGYSFNIESRGRGHDMFMFNRVNEPFFTTTYAEVYILDKEYITVKEARKWDNLNFSTEDIEIIEPMEAPALQSPILGLIARVNSINHNSVRLDFTPDHRLVGRGVHKQNFGQRALFLLKQLTGVTYVKSHRNFNRNWDRFKKYQTHKKQDPNK